MVRARRAWQPVLVLAMVATSVVGMWSRESHVRAQPAIVHPPLRKIAEFELPGPPGKRFDYLTIDEDDNYLLSAVAEFSLQASPGFELTDPGVFLKGVLRKACCKTSRV